MQRVVFVLFPGFQSLDLTGPYEVFAGANEVLRRTEYQLTTVASVAGVVRAESGLAFVADHALADLDPRTVDALVTIGGNGVYEAAKDVALVQWIRTAAATAQRVVSVCTGTFLLAEAGLLQGRTVTTHWARARRLAREHPEVTVDADPIFIRSGEVWTSAGVTAGIDLALAMVEADLDAEVAQTVARWLVMFLRRPGGQTQFAAPVWSAPPARTGLRTVQDRVHAEPGADHSVATLAGIAAMSERNFLRVFSREVGCTPAAYVERVRVEAARRQLEQSGDGVDVVAHRCGFGTAETMRRAFVRRLGVSPTDYRLRFSKLNNA